MTPMRIPLNASPRYKIETDSLTNVSWTRELPTLPRAAAWATATKNVKKPPGKKRTKFYKTKMLYMDPKLHF